MTATKQSVESSYLNARAKFLEWAESYQERYVQPEMNQELLAVWKSMTTEQHAAAKQADPRMYGETEKLVKKLEARNGRT